MTEKHFGIYDEDEVLKNETGVVIGRLSRSDLIKLIRDCTEPNLREKFANWVICLEGSEELVISLPIRDPELEKLNRKIRELTSKET